MVPMKWQLKLSYIHRSPTHSMTKMMISAVVLHYSWQPYKFLLKCNDLNGIKSKLKLTHFDAGRLPYGDTVKNVVQTFKTTHFTLLFIRLFVI